MKHCSLIKLVVVLTCTLASSAIFATDFTSCRKFSSNIIGVVCPPLSDGTKNGALLTFKQADDESWEFFYQKNELNPEKTKLSGPNLAGPGIDGGVRITEHGLEACNRYCVETKEKN